MKKKIICSLLAMLIIPLMVSAQWQAMMTNSIQGNVQLYKVHSDGNQYSYEFNSDGMHGIVIVKPDENKTAIMLVNEKKVHYTKSDGMMSQMNDPVQAYKGSLVYGEEKNEGAEEINSYHCIKTVIYLDEKPLITQWFSEDLNFPVKIENHYTTETFMLLENIESWDVDQSIFTVPKDYIEVDDEMRPVIPEPSPPEEWEEIEVTVPFDMEVGCGMMITVPIDETVYHKFTIENTGDTPAKYIYHMYKNDVELPDDVQGPEEQRSDRLYMDETYRMTHNWKAGQLIKINIYEGNVRVKITKE